MLQLLHKPSLKPRTRLSQANPLHLWHLLSLDAPTVATLWTAFIARSFRVPLPAVVLVAMFLMVWFLYAADRLLDAHPLHHQPTRVTDLERRHLFHHRHRRAFLTALSLVVVALAALIPHLPAAALPLFLVLGTLLAGYFVLIHAVSGANRLPKEIAVGLFFSAAIFIPTLASLPHSVFSPASSSILSTLHGSADPRLALLPPAVLFAAVCCLNCLSIYAWEHPHASQPTTPHCLTQAASHHRRALATAILLSAWLYAFLAHTSAGVAIGLSSLALRALDQQRIRLSSLSLRAAADLALLTPVLFLPWMSSVPWTLPR